jgi:hypothetical protein
MKKTMKKVGLLLALAVGFVLGSRSRRKPHEMFETQQRGFAGRPRIQTGQSRATESVEVIELRVQEVEEILFDAIDPVVATASAYDRMMTEKAKEVADFATIRARDDDGQSHRGARARDIEASGRGE